MGKIKFTTTKTIIFVIIIFLLFSCALPHDYEFINNSSYTLHIQPNGQDWNDFYLSPDYSRIVTIYEDNIYFMYNYATSVDCDTSGKSTIVFTNKS